ncbi:hypothetical protein H072_7333 [Dactylellina haptotyla CBS 200.50]|uniref:Uncharacterized protein n=1 Tax=Dactylellina haptotyla (strain CBS 200.50) TaxID=1284197 RepID=S8A7F3_DACHA|nr:hypothetical protein H072_7333 [Dactylellina haptotyla CBS 200.50]
MSNSPVDSARPHAQVPVLLSPMHPPPITQPQTLSHNTVEDVNRVENIPTAPPPAYIPPPAECRSSRIYDFEDLGPNGNGNPNDDDLERAQPPPPYMPPTRQQQPTVVIYSRLSQAGDAAAVVHYPTMDSYIKRSRRMKLYGAVTLGAIIVVGIVLLGSLIARQKLGSSDQPDRN